MSPTCAGTYPYTVRPGDTLWMIAQRFHTTVEEIASANPGLDANNLFIGQVICIPQRSGRAPMPAARMEMNHGKLALNNLMRLLWEQHVFWTRLVVLGIVFGLPDTEFSINRLLRNPEDFEAALAPLYGDDIAAEFAQLLTSHLTIAAELVQAMKAGDGAAAANAEKRWYANADQIATFLSDINPYWTAQEWRRMLYDHLAMTKTEATDLLTQKYADSDTIFDNIEREALEMADLMTQGIIRQFPKSFR